MQRCTSHRLSQSGGVATFVDGRLQSRHEHDQRRHHPVVGTKPEGDLVHRSRQDANVQNQQVFSAFWNHGARWKCKPQMTHEGLHGLRNERDYRGRKIQQQVMLCSAAYASLVVQYPRRCNYTIDIGPDIITDYHLYPIHTNGSAVMWYQSSGKNRKGNGGNLILGQTHIIPAYLLRARTDYKQVLTILFGLVMGFEGRTGLDRMGLAYCTSQW